MVVYPLCLDYPNGTPGVQPHPAPESNQSDPGQVRLCKPAINHTLHSNPELRLDWGGGCVFKEVYGQKISSSSSSSWAPAFLCVQVTCVVGSRQSHSLSDDQVHHCVHRNTRNTHTHTHAGSPSRQEDWATAQSTSALKNGF